MPLMFGPFGGYLSVPVSSLLRGREPWTSLVLLSGLFAVLWLMGGFIINTSPLVIFGVWAIGAIIYLISASVGGFRNPIESFSVAHIMALIAFGGMLLVESKKNRMGPQKAPASTVRE